MPPANTITPIPTPTSTPSVGPTPGLPQTHTPEIPLGMNVNFNSYAAPLVWTDVKNSLGQWGLYDAPYVPNPSLTFTADGYPLQDASAMTFLQDYPDGIYKFSYEGQAEVTLDERYLARLTNVQRTGNLTTADIVVEHERGGFLVVRIKNNDPNNPVRNMHILTPGYETRSERMFTDEFVRRLRPFRTLRMMDFTYTNDNPQANWEDRVKPSDFLQTGEKGVAWEYAIALANEVGRDAWINVPDQATDDYVINLAKLIHEKLDPTLRVYVEFSNEVWNSSFKQFGRTHIAADLNPELTAPLDDYVTRVQQQVAFRVKRISEIFRSEFGSDFGRVIIVLAGQGVNPWIVTQALNFLQNKYGTVSGYVGALSMAAYVHFLEESDRPGITLDQLFANLNDYVDNMVAPRVRAHKQLAQESGNLPLVAYEGSQALMGANGLNQELKLEAQYDPRMGALLEKLFRTWKAEGGAEFVTNGFVGPYSYNKYWCSLERMYQAGSPKWDVLMRLLLPPGDVTLDGRVTYEDFAVLRNNCNAAAQQAWESGDFNGDRTVSALDFEMMHDNLTDLSPEQEAEINEFAGGRGDCGGERGYGVIVDISSEAYTSENLQAAEFTVQLSSRPSAPVTIPLYSTKMAEASIDPDKLIFTPDNWNGPQVVTVTGTDDSEYDGDRAYAVETGLAISDDPNYRGLKGPDVHLVNRDNEPYGTTIDNLDLRVLVIGEWTAASVTSGYYGSNYFHDGNDQKGSKSIEYRPNLGTPGNYEVFLRWTAGANRATNVPVDIVHAGDFTTLQVNQQDSGGQWVSLGTFNCDGTNDALIIRTDGTDGYVIADAARFVAVPQDGMLLSK